MAYNTADIFTYPPYIFLILARFKTTLHANLRSHPLYKELQQKRITHLKSNAMA